MVLRKLILGRALGLLALAGVAGGTAFWLQSRTDDRDREIARLEAETQYLQEVADRLTLEERVARIVVVDQQRDSQETLVTDLLFFDVSKDGVEVTPPRAFRVYGEQVHVGALLIRFEEHFVREGDPLRGRTLALWDKIHGSATAAEQGQPIDPIGESPRVYAGGSEGVTATGDADDRRSFETELWADFWRLANDEAFAAEKGVRVAHGQQVYSVFEPGRVYDLTLQANGGLSLASRPMPPLYRELLRRPADASD